MHTTPVKGHLNINLKNGTNVPVTLQQIELLFKIFMKGKKLSKSTALDQEMEL